jgi:hypothetical protein
MSMGGTRDSVLMASTRERAEVERTAQFGGAAGGDQASHTGGAGFAGIERVQQGLRFGNELVGDSEEEAGSRAHSWPGGEGDFTTVQALHDGVLRAG